MIDPNAGSASAGSSSPTIVYDGGPCTVQNLFHSQSYTNSGLSLVAAAPGLRTKVLVVQLSCHTFTTSGFAVLKDGAGNNLASIMLVTALGQTVQADGAGFVYTQTPVKSALQFFYTGNGGFMGQLVYYQAA